MTNMTPNEFVAALKTTRNPFVETIDRDLKETAKNAILKKFTSDVLQRAKTKSIAIAVIELK